MPQVPSHYDTLQVPQGASLETIRASYKQLARQYHPDRNSNSANSHCLMQAINAAFEVLGDPVRRADYDEWLIRLDHARGNPLSVVFRKFSGWIQSRSEDLTDLVDRIKPVREITAARWVARVGFVALVLWGLNLDREPTLHADTPNSTLNQHDRSMPENRTAAITRPLHAPNGSAWPAQAGEIAGYPIDRNDGLSIVTVDNSGNPADVFAKLIALDHFGALPIRHLYIPARESFECRNVRKGIYEVRYQDIGSGLAARSGRFEVVETSTPHAVNYSVMRIRLARITDTKPEGLKILQREF
ncbi:MAG TPA: J domain-containing protein [Opitutus sp.]|nr:J domain-containing protein [Opitutus sp.]